MKKKIIFRICLYFFSLSFFFSFFFSGPHVKTVLACNDSCGGDCSVLRGCWDCPGCPMAGHESTYGKVVNPVLPTELSTTTGIVFLQKMLRTGILILLVAGLVIFVFMLFSGAVRWISAGGDKGKLEGAQKQITHSIVGLTILLCGFAIIKLIEYIFGISILNITFPVL